MNIVVIGSDADSSTLAKDLNKRLKNSIVARVDLMKSIKQLVLSGLNVVTTENLGTYVGDVETFDYKKLSTEQRNTVAKAIKDITTTMTILSPNTGKEFRASGNIGNTFDALTNGIPTSTYSFIKVYSGIIDDVSVNKMIADNNFVPNAIVVVVKNPTTPIVTPNVSKTLLDTVKTNAFSFIECDSIQDVFKSETFKLLFELTNESETTEQKSTVDMVTAIDNDDILEEEFELGMAA